MFGYNFYTLQHPNSKIHFFTRKKNCHIRLYLHAKCLHQRHINSRHQLQNMLLTEGCKPSQHQLQNILVTQGCKHSQHQLQNILLTQGCKHSHNQLQNTLLTQCCKPSQHQLQNMLLTQDCKHSQHKLQLRFFIQTHLQNAFPHCAGHFVSCNTQYSLQAYKTLNL